MCACSQFHYICLHDVLLKHIVRRPSSGVRPGRPPVQRLTRQIDSFVHRHRRLVLAAWVVALLAALPFAARQSDHLSGGGFTVPGSDSAAVDRELRSEFPRFERSPLIAVVAPEKGAPAADVARARARVVRAVRAEDNARVAPPRRGANRQSAVERPTLI